jgi:glutamate synthase domain-containing protein 2/glutamate synthase domain-containing protein 1/glutamate synthase domain-containing protein 3
MAEPYKFPDLPPLTKQGLYDPANEHDACGVGMVANINGERSHKIIDQGIEVLINLGHRGACGADPRTGDGAGILIQVPHEFFHKECAALDIDLPHRGEYAVGMTFLPQEPEQRQACEGIVESIVAAEGQKFLGWRDVPVNPDAIGVLAAHVMPRIRQFFVRRSADIQDELRFELKLYVIRKQIEQAIAAADMPEKDVFYICSLSSRTLVYKGLLIADQIAPFYHDLSHESLTSAFALVHSRFSTNTLGTWKLAHPYRFIIHNGEINTLRGNINWMAAREAMFVSPELGGDVEKLKPVIPRNAQSDTATLDNALELLMATGRSLPHAMMMLIPEAWADHIPMDAEKKAFYAYHSTLMEPWDGPALVIGTDGTRVCAILDRNGLRPCRYLVTTDGLLVMASETGVLDVPPENVVFKRRIQPGRMFLLDTEAGRLIDDTEIKRELSTRKPYGEWLAAKRVLLEDLPKPASVAEFDDATLLKRQQAFGYSQEDLEILMEPMATTGAEAVGSMGNDIPLAVLSDMNPLLFGYFRQLFAQVSNPPLDAIREELVTSLETFIGSEQNLFDETPEHCHQLKLKEPFLTNQELARIRELNVGKLRSKTLSILFDVSDSLSKNGQAPDGEPKPSSRPWAGTSSLGRTNGASTPNATGAMRAAIDHLCAEASQAVADGYPVLILSDRGVDQDHAAIPSLLATAAVHHHLIREGTRTRVGLVVESAEPREVHHFAMLIGYGAGAVNPYLALETLNDLCRRQVMLKPVDFHTAQKNYVKALHKGVLKIMSKMGISTLQSYRGAQIFEAVGLSQEFVDRYFTWTPSPLGGIGLDEIEAETLARHAAAYPKRPIPSNLDLRTGGYYQWRRDGEYHMYNPDSIALLQYSTRTGNFQSFQEFTDLIDRENTRLCTIRGLLEFQPGNSIPIEDVEPAQEIVKRFATGAASLGSISREAHETLAIAMNRIGARSNTGEGGEDYHRYKPDPNGDSRNSAIKQVASGRFGVTINYLANATDLQIKMAQGSKPGEGGQLPGHKVDEYIGWVRHTTPGVELISPPPHHDIYSIEDLGQLIHDLKNSNPSARIHVKLVSEVGVGTIAAGVSKGHGDVVLISGDSGGTGASPESSIKNAGLPWELGVAETQQVLVANDLRGRIVVQTDGQLKTGRDVAIACLLGAEEFGFATAPLIVMGCIMLRKCHLNTCSVGIATQDPELRKRFAGEPEHVINYFFFVAEQLRQIMARLGFRTVNEMIGRVDMLDGRKAIEHWKARGLDFSALLHKPNVPVGVATYRCEDQDHGLDRALDHELIRRSQPAIERREPTQVDVSIRNSNRTTGAMLSYEIARRYGEEGLPEGTLQVNFHGSAGQSFAAFLAKGIRMNVEGDANDYFCKGLSGGTVVIRPPTEATFVPEENILVGNVVLYGATAGKAFIRGIAGERFAVRNSGAEAVVEGVGDHGCEYMTGGRVVVLGPTGRNFAAGMSGGEAFVLDEAGSFRGLCNQEMVDLEDVVSDEDKADLQRLVEEHFHATGSANAYRVLKDWDAMLPRFVKVMPRDYKRVLLERQLRAEAAALEAVAN